MAEKLKRAASLILLVASGALAVVGIVSYSYTVRWWVFGEYPIYHDPSVAEREGYVAVERGKMWTFHRVYRPGPRRDTPEMTPLPFEILPPSPSPGSARTWSWRVGRAKYGFEARHFLNKITGSEDLNYSVCFPIWLLSVLLVAYPAFRLVSALLRKRVRLGHCSSCQYDLTGNVTGTCPECGERC